MRKVICLTAIMACILSCVQCAVAKPSINELQSYNCLIPDWSKTSGGSSPEIWLLNLKQR